MSLFPESFSIIFLSSSAHLSWSCYHNQIDYSWKHVWCPHSAVCRDIFSRHIPLPLCIFYSSHTRNTLVFHRQIMSIHLYVLSVGRLRNMPKIQKCGVSHHPSLQHPVTLFRRLHDHTESYSQVPAIHITCYFPSLLGKELVSIFKI